MIVVLRCWKSHSPAQIGMCGQRRMWRAKGGKSEKVADFLHTRVVNPKIVRTFAADYRVRWGR